MQCPHPESDIVAAGSVVHNRSPVFGGSGPRAFLREAFPSYRGAWVRDITFLYYSSLSSEYHVFCDEVQRHLLHKGLRDDVMQEFVAKYFTRVTGKVESVD